MLILLPNLLNRSLAQPILAKQRKESRSAGAEVYEQIDEAPSTGNDAAMQSQNRLRTSSNEEADAALYLPSCLIEIMLTLDGLIAESERGARRYLKRYKTKKKVHLMPVALLNSGSEDIDFLLEPLLEGERWGVISDAGLPCLADPGAQLVARAKERGIEVRAISGPSSITLALMQSGLSGQRFSFRGYIAKEPEQRKKELLAWQKCAMQENSTQIFIEAPYRNSHTYLDCLRSLHPKTLLCVACNMTASDEIIMTLPVAKHTHEFAEKLMKKPTIFLFSTAEHHLFSD